MNESIHVVLKHTKNLTIKMLQVYINTVPRSDEETLQLISEKLIVINNVILSMFEKLVHQ